ncbi:MAG: helix-turn-helix transcriptional regulator [Clostridiales bacterium]|jgi:DNA-binding HxlR family transcriptional regulator|nr:helix-turn-helix transcriptional regulator [Clostridiales bacterium]
MKKEKEKKKKRLKKESSAPAAPETAEENARPSQNEPELPPELARDPLQHAVQIIGGKWKIRILWALRGGESLRYGDIRRQIPGITDMMLSQSLRELTESGLTERKQYRQIPPRVDYSITPAGAELIPILNQLCAWSAKQGRKDV